MIRALIIFLLSGLIAVRPPYKNALTLTKISKIYSACSIITTIRMVIFFIFVRAISPYFCKQPIDAYQGNRLRPRAWRNVRKIAY